MTTAVPSEASIFESDPTVQSVQEDAPLFTDFQNRFLSFLPGVVAIPSWVGSGLILYVILKERRTLMCQTYHRIIFGLSVFDFVFSLQYTVFLGAWSIPEEVDFVVGARASSFVPCSINGFLMVLSVGSTLYTISLMVNFVMTLYFKVSKDFIERRVEPWMHIVSCTIPLVMATAGAWQGMMNPLVGLPGICFLQPFPPDCTEDDDLSTEDCERGEDFAVISTLGAAFINVAFIVIFVSMILILRTVWKTERSMNQYAGGVLSQHGLKRTRATAIRGIQYILAFLVYALPIYVYNIVFFRKSADEENQMSFLVSSIIVSVFSLNQGLYNAIIYFNPRFKELIRADGTLFFLRPFVSFFAMFCCCRAICQCCICGFISSLRQETTMVSGATTGAAAANSSTIAILQSGLTSQGASSQGEGSNFFRRTPSGVNAKSTDPADTIGTEAVKEEEAKEDVEEQGIPILALVEEIEENDTSGGELETPVRSDHDVNAMINDDADKNEQCTVAAVDMVDGFDTAKQISPSTEVNSPTEERNSINSEHFKGQTDTIVVGLSSDDFFPEQLTVPQSSDPKPFV